jgi:uncharacterized protein (TIGR03382 family)
MMKGYRNAMAVALGGVLLLAAPAAFAQSEGGVNPECLGNDCGTPEQEGGGCSCGCSCSVWVARTDDGTQLAFSDDRDQDGRKDDRDNCPLASNRDQADGDGDGMGNVCDNCVGAANLDQVDADGDGQGNACDADDDGDGLLDAQDNCSGVPNSSQANADGDAMGDACDADADGDGRNNGNDNCPLIANADQVMPADPSSCKVDSDGDGVGDTYDVCPAHFNPDQKDTDGDFIGEVCDLDIDNDGIFNEKDNCVAKTNLDQLDEDNDGLGNACDAKFCYVFDPSTPEACLNPLSPFQVSGGGHLNIRKGETLVLPLFANRNGAAMEYTWTVTKRPEGSKAAVEHPKGSVTVSQHWNYIYPEDRAPTFTADVEGDYEVQVYAKLAFRDRAYPEVTDSTGALKLNIANKGLFGCSALPAGPIAGFGLMLLALTLGRRRRS